MWMNANCLKVICSPKSQLLSCDVSVLLSQSCSNIQWGCGWPIGPTCESQAVPGTPRHCLLWNVPKAQCRFTVLFDYRGVLKRVFASSNVWVIVIGKTCGRQWSRAASLGVAIPAGSWTDWRMSPDIDDGLSVSKIRTLDLRTGVSSSCRLTAMYRMAVLIR
jgi:hypothetical protein